MIVLFWGMFLTTPSLGISEDFDQTFMYSSVILALILSLRYNTRKSIMNKMVALTSWQMWQKLAYLTPRQMTYLGMQWGVSSQQLRKLVSYRSVIRNKGRGKARKPRGLALKHKKKHLNRTIDFYRKLPLKVMSRAWGKFNELDLPVVLRRPLLGLYVWLFNCNMEEAMDKELRNYRNLGEFFRRILRPDVRKIHNDQVTSPADGRILHFGVVKDGILEQVKGVTYSLKGFLGPPSWQGHIYDIKHLTDSEYFQTLKIKPDHELYHCVIYLAPGDYHRFHSATNWIVQYRRHFPGDLLSVNPSIAKWLKGLFNFNERVVYAGTWEHGFFSYTPVGATNVGSIKVYCDKELQTNTGHKHHTLGTHYDKDLRDSDKNGVDILKGEMFGEFNLGSTVVLVFEAPKNFKFSVENNQKVRMGEPLGTVV